MAQYAEEMDKQEAARQRQLEALKAWQVRPAMAKQLASHSDEWFFVPGGGGLSARVRPSASASACSSAPLRLKPRGSAAPGAAQAKQEKEAAARPEAKRWIDPAIIDR